MKNKILLGVFCGMGMLYPGDAPVKRMKKLPKTVKWADESNQLYNQFEKHLDQDYYAQLPSEGEYKPLRPLGEEVAEWRQEYEDVLKEDIESHVLLDYLDFEEEATLQAMAAADGLAQTLIGFLVPLNEAINNHERSVAKMKAILLEEGKSAEDISRFELDAQRHREEAQALRDFFLEKIESLKSFRTPH
jgi:hypothetical protein